MKEASTRFEIFSSTSIGVQSVRMETPSVYVTTAKVTLVRHFSVKKLALENEKINPCSLDDNCIYETIRNNLVHPEIGLCSVHSRLTQLV